MKAVRMASYVDHTLLRADATHGDIDRLCAEAIHHHFAAVCVAGGEGLRGVSVGGGRRG